jgi:type IV secretory pathway TraG/TraD family ATPase VirD4
MGLVMNNVFNALELISGFIDRDFWLYLGGVLFVLTLIGYSPINAEKETSTGQIFLVKLRITFYAILTGMFLILPLVVACCGLIIDSNKWHEIFYAFGHDFLSGFLGSWSAPAAGILAAVLLRIAIVRYYMPLRSKFWRSLRFKQSAESLSDIRVEQGKYKTQDFTPSKYYKKDKVFYGLTQEKTPLYVSLEDWKTQNQKIIGPTQTGKGVLIGVQLDQSIRNNDCTVFVDPKGDKHAVHIMNKACLETGRKLLVLDLNKEKNISLGWEPFFGGEKRERRSRLHFAFGLANTGTDADFHKGRERKIIDRVFDKWDGTIKNLNSILSSGYEDDVQRTISSLDEWGCLQALNVGKRTLSLDDFLKDGGVLYVKGSLNDETIIKATTVFIMELVQSLIRLYNSKERSKHLFAVIDEVRFLMTDLFADSLATVCGFDAHFAIAYQSILDVRNVKDRNVNGLALEQSVNINCKQTFCYMAADTETAEWASDQTGETQKSVTRMEGVETNSLGGEVWEKRRLVNRETENLIPKNTFRILPPRTAVFYSPAQLAKIVYTCWVSVDEKNKYTDQVIDVKNENKRPEKRKKNEENNIPLPPPPLPDPEPIEEDQQEILEPPKEMLESLESIGQKKEKKKEVKESLDSLSDLQNLESKKEI